MSCCSQRFISVYVSLDFVSHMTEIDSPSWSDSVRDLSYDVPLSEFINNPLGDLLVFSLLTFSSRLFSIVQEVNNTNIKYIPKLS